MALFERFRYFQFRKKHGLFPNKIIDSFGPKRAIETNHGLYYKEGYTFEFGHLDF